MAAKPRRPPPDDRPDRIARFYAEVNRNDAQRRAEDLRAAGDRGGARRAAQEAIRFDKEAQRLLRLEELAHARERRDYFAKIGITLAEAGDLAGAQRAAKEAVKWERDVKRLAKSLPPG